MAGSRQRHSDPSITQLSTSLLQWRRNRIPRPLLLQIVKQRQVVVLVHRNGRGFFGVFGGTGCFLFGARFGGLGFAFGADAFEQHRRRLVVGVLRHQFTTEGFGEDGLVELIKSFDCRYNFLLKVIEIRESVLDALLRIWICSASDGNGIWIRPIKRYSDCINRPQM